MHHAACLLTAAVFLQAQQTVPTPTAVSQRKLANLIPGFFQDTYVRGFSRVALLILDEAAFVPDLLYKALNPMLAVSGGALWLMSTPMDNPASFTRNGMPLPPLGSATNFLPPMPPHGQRFALGDQIYRQEYECEFLSTGTQVFSQELLQQSFDDLYHPSTLAARCGAIDPCQLWSRTSSSVSIWAVARILSAIAILERRQDRPDI